MELLRTLLLALQYSKTHSFDYTDETSFRSLVYWLETVKIRYYSPDDRKALADIKSTVWPDAYSKYVQDVLECPITLTTGNRQAVLEWIVSFAVNLQYTDHAEQYNAAASKLMEQQHQAALDQQAFPDLHSPEVQQQLSRLFELLHVNTTTGSLAHHLQAASEVLRDSVLPSLTDSSVQQNSLQDFPLGFETGDAQVDGLAMLLRMLYIKDLRQLQTAIDKIVVQVQEYTANPRTDASLGKVGR